MLRLSVQNSFHNSNGASREFAVPLTNVLRRRSSGPIRWHVSPDSSTETRWTVPPACCRSRRPVSPHQERRSAASQQHYRFLSACVRPKSQHEGDGDTRGVFRWRRMYEMSTISVRRAPLLGLSLSLQGGSAPLWVYTPTHPPPGHTPGTCVTVIPVTPLFAAAPSSFIDSSASRRLADFHPRVRLRVSDMTQAFTRGKKVVLHTLASTFSLLKSVDFSSR